MSAPRLRSPAGFLPIATADAALIVASFVAASYWTALLDAYLYFSEEGSGERLIPLVGVLLLTIYFADLYSRRPGTNHIYRAQQLSLVAGVGLLFEAFLSWINPDAILPRNLMFAGIGLTAVVLFVWRTVLDFLLRRFSGPRSVLFLGGGETLLELRDHIAAHPELNLTAVGSLSNEPERAVAPVLGSLNDIREVVRQVRPDLIIAGVDEKREQLPVHELLDLRFSGATIEEVGSAFEMICHRISSRDLRPSRVLFTRDFEPGTGQLLIPVADRVIAIVLLILGLPVALIWSALVMASGRAVIRSRVCAGYRGAPFTQRSFTIPEWGPVSRIMRSLRLSEYPDLWNVLIGRMSMVGPRPATLSLDRELARVIPIFEYRRNAKPGIASWARVHAEIRQPVPDTIREVEYDLFYVGRQSATLYAFVLLHGLRRHLT